MTAIRLCTHPTPVEEAARLLAELLAVDSPRLAVSGGSALSVLPALKERLGPRHATLRLTYADERAVPYESVESNAGAARAFCEGTADELRLYLGGETLEEAQARAARAFDARFGGLDAVLLGLGGDGHVASHFPGVAAVPAGASVQLVRESPKPPASRLTLSLGVIAPVPVVIFARGDAKRGAIAAALKGDPMLPTNRLEHCTVVTDLVFEVPEGVT